MSPTAGRIPDIEGGGRLELGESKRTSEQPKEGQPGRLEGFEEMVEWARSNGWTDFDFEGLERRVVELARVMGEKPADAPSMQVMKPTEKTVPFMKKLDGKSQGKP